MNYMKIDKCSVTNGIGVRTVLWVSGCTLNCRGCQNPECHSFDAGKAFNEDSLKQLLEYLSKPYIQGLTISGGHPLEDRNLNDVYNIIKRVKMVYPTKDIWIYSGYTLKEIIERDEAFEKHEVNGISPFDVIKECDVLVDGRFDINKRDISLAFRGSSNQKIIDIKETFKNNKITLWEEK